MRQLLTFVLLAGMLASPAAPARAYTLQFTNSGATTQVRWPGNSITIALSNSLNAPPTNIEATPAQTVAAARRALRTWSEAANIQFNVLNSAEEDLDPNDGTSLITVSAINANQFSGIDQKGRARIRFDTSGQILEGDVGVNPNVRFSTDGRFGTYDLESTFVHEIGHILGLEHSGIVGATMQPRQGVNGTFNLSALTARTLSEDDRAGIRSIYGPRAGVGALAGTVTYASGAPAFGAHVWAEDTVTGRVMGGNIALPNGAYRIENLPPASYRVVAEFLNEPVDAGEIASRNGAYQNLSTTSTLPFATQEVGTFGVTDGGTTSVSITVGGTSVFLNPSFIGANGQLSTIALPLAPGSTTNVLVGGDNVQAALAGGLTVTSPFMTVSNLRDLGFFNSVRVVSFDVTVSFAAPPGEYSVRLQSANEVAYVTGGLVIDLPNGVTSENPIDNATFFVAQHYRDFLNREPDAAGLAFWVNQITACGTNAACTEVRRINVSAAFFLSAEFQQTGYLVYKTYGAAFGTTRIGSTVPLTFQEFLPDTQRLGRGVIVNTAGWEQQLEANKVAFFNEFVARPQFLAQYPTTMSPAQFVDALNANTGGSLSPAQRDDLVNRLIAGQLTRAQVLRAVAEDADFDAREKNRAFVLMQYFGYLRRNPFDAPELTLDFQGYNFWLSKLNQFGGDYVAAELVKAFITSAEYRARFGPQ